MILRAQPSQAPDPTLREQHARVQTPQVSPLLVQQPLFSLVSSLIILLRKASFTFFHVKELVLAFFFLK